MSWIQAAAAALPIVGGIVGEILASGDDAEAERLRQQAMAQYNIDIPPLEQLKAEAVQSQAAGAQGDTYAKGIRRDALRQLAQRGQEGYTAEDRAAIADSLSEVDQNTRGRNEAMLRGLNPNSGAALAVRAQNAQAATQAANRRGLDIAAGSRRAALQALAQSGTMAGQMDSDEFGQSFQRGQAGDAIARFNEANRLDVLRGNQQAQLARTGQQMQLAGAKAGQYEQAAGGYERKGARKRQQWAAMGQGAGEGAAGYAKASK